VKGLENLGELEICPDCLWASVNGTGDRFAEFGEGFLARWEKAGALECDPKINEHGEIEGGFSWSSCDHCGDTLGGYRFTVWAYGLKTGGNK
jgi:hypothetical protein